MENLRSGTAEAASSCSTLYCLLCLAKWLHTWSRAQY
jgi:hypothetical protein